MPSLPTNEAVYDMVLFTLPTDDEVPPKDELVSENPPEGIILVKSIMARYWFNQNRLEEKAPEIKEWLFALHPDLFTEGGTDFAKLGIFASGDIWTFDAKMLDGLLALSVALGFGEILSRELYTEEGVPKMPQVKLYIPKEKANA